MGERKPKRKELERNGGMRKGGVRRKALAKARRRKEMMGVRTKGRERWLRENEAEEKVRGREWSWRKGGVSRKALAKSRRRKVMMGSESRRQRTRA